MLFPIIIFCFFFCSKNNTLKYNIFPKNNGTCINDFANLINETDKKTIYNLCDQIKNEGLAVIVVCTLDSIPKVKKEYENEMIYCTDLFKNWNIGSKNAKDGLLFFISRYDRKVVIHTGYFTEHILPDSSAGRILDSYVIPKLKMGAYGEGIINGIYEAKAVMSKNMKLMEPSREIN
jgi:uncharacterized protein